MNEHALKVLRRSWRDFQRLSEDRKPGQLLNLVSWLGEQIGPSLEHIDIQARQIECLTEAANYAASAIHSLALSEPEGRIAYEKLVRAISADPGSQGDGGQR